MQDDMLRLLSGIELSLLGLLKEWAKVRKRRSKREKDMIGVPVPNAGFGMGSWKFE